VAFAGPAAGTGRGVRRSAVFRLSGFSFASPVGGFPAFRLFVRLAGWRLSGFPAFRLSGFPAFRLFVRLAGWRISGFSAFRLFVLLAVRSKCDFVKPVLAEIDLLVLFNIVGPS
jgi:hypothetical protein